MKRTVISAALILLTVLIGVPASAHATPPGHSVSLRVATYNIHAGSGADEVFDVDRTAAQISDLDADVVGLQEVDVHWDARSEWRDLARELAHRLHMHVFFGPIYSLDPSEVGGPRAEFGNAILSKYPIMSAHNHSIARLSSQDPDPVLEPSPGFPEAVINVRGVWMQVFSTHLDFRADPLPRQAQVTDMLEIMGAGRKMPQVLLGDFNAEPQSPEIGPLWDHLDDAWLAAGGSPGEGATYPAGEPQKRIDFVAVSPSMRVIDAHAVASSASDHHPVVAELSVPRW